MKGLRLEIESIPQTSWGLSLSNLLDKKDWDKIRRKAYKEAGYACVICGKGDIKLQAHEAWKFDDSKKTQTLVRLEVLCNKCHQVKHFGRSSQVYREKYIEELINHWCKVNRKSKQDFYIYLGKVKDLNLKRVKNRYRVFVQGEELSF